MPNLIEFAVLDPLMQRVESISVANIDLDLGGFIWIYVDLGGFKFIYEVSVRQPVASCGSLWDGTPIHTMYCVLRISICSLTDIYSSWLSSF